MDTWLMLLCVVIVLLVVLLILFFVSKKKPRHKNPHKNTTDELDGMFLLNKDSDKNL